MVSFNHVLNVPTPSKITYMWNFGSLLGFMLLAQIVSGIFLCLCYTANSDMSFFVMDYMIRDVEFGDIMRKFHANGASFFFFFLYVHFGRGIYYSSFKKKIYVWFTGITMFLMSMAIAFFGYVLPWGQMSYWGATVMTKLFSVVPFVGKAMVEWLWGGFSVKNSTLTRFFGLHVILPFILIFFVFTHMVFLHFSGSSNPVGMGHTIVSFHPYWSAKDMLGILIVGLFLKFLVFLTPFIFMDVENFFEAKFMVTPEHIQPEWYFLPAYAVLRSIPKKLGGVIGLIMVFFIFYFKPTLFSTKMFGNKSKKILFWWWSFSVVGLLWIGSCSVEGLYIIFGQVFSVLYFLLMFFLFENGVISIEGR